MELKTVAIENPDDIHHRKDLLRRFGYKLG